MSTERRDFFRRTLGVIISLPFLNNRVLDNRVIPPKFTLLESVSQNKQGNISGVLHRLSLKVDKNMNLDKEIEMDMEIINDSSISIQTPTMQSYLSELGTFFGVVYYLDPRGLFLEFEN